MSSSRLQHHDTYDINTNQRCHASLHELVNNFTLLLGKWNKKEVINDETFSTAVFSCLDKFFESSDFNFTTYLPKRGENVISKLQGQLIDLTNCFDGNLVALNTLAKFQMKCFQIKSNFESAQVIQIVGTTLIESMTKSKKEIGLKIPIIELGITIVIPNKKLCFTILYYFSRSFELFLEECNESEILSYFEYLQWFRKFIEKVADIPIFVLPHLIQITTHPRLLRLLQLSDYLELFDIITARLGNLMDSLLSSSQSLNQIHADLFYPIVEVVDKFIQHSVAGRTRGAGKELADNLIEQVALRILQLLQRRNYRLKSVQLMELNCSKDQCLLYLQRIIITLISGLSLSLHMHSNPALFVDSLINLHDLLNCVIDCPTFDVIYHFTCCIFAKCPNFFNTIHAYFNDYAERMENSNVPSKKRKTLGDISYFTPDCGEYFQTVTKQKIGSTTNKGNSMFVHSVFRLFESIFDSIATEEIENVDIVIFLNGLFFHIIAKLMDKNRIDTPTLIYFRSIRIRALERIANNKSDLTSYAYCMLLLVVGHLWSSKIDDQLIIGEFGQQLKDLEMISLRTNQFSIIQFKFFSSSFIGNSQFEICTFFKSRSIQLFLDAVHCNSFEEFLSQSFQLNQSMNDVNWQQLLTQFLLTIQNKIKMTIESHVNINQSENIQNKSFDGSGVNLIMKSVSFVISLINHRSEYRIDDATMEILLSTVNQVTWLSSYAEDVLKLNAYKDYLPLYDCDLTEFSILTLFNRKVLSVRLVFIFRYVDLSMTSIKSESNFNTSFRQLKTTIEESSMNYLTSYIDGITRLFEVCSQAFEIWTTKCISILGNFQFFWILSSSISPHGQDVLKRKSIQSFDIMMRILDAATSLQIDTIELCSDSFAMILISLLSRSNDDQAIALPSQFRSMYEYITKLTKELYERDQSPTSLSAADLSQISISETKLLIISRSLGKFCKYYGTFEPKVACHCLIYLIQSIVDSAFVYHIYFEIFRDLSQSWTFPLLDYLILHPNYASKALYPGLLANDVALNVAVIPNIGVENLNMLMLNHGPLIMSGILLTEDEVTRDKMQAFKAQGFLQHGRQNYSSFASFLELNSVAFIQILLSDNLQRHSTKEILTSKLYEVLQATAGFLNIPMNDSSFLSSTSCQKILTSFIWRLGRDDSNFAIKRSLLLFAVLFKFRQWKFKDSITIGRKSIKLSSKDFEAYLNINVQNMLNNNFYYIISKLFPVNWLSQYHFFQCQSLKALKQIVRLVDAEVINKLLPKLSVILGSATKSPAAMIKYEAIVVLRLTVEKLTDPMLKLNVQSLLIIAYPVLDKNVNLSEDERIKICNQDYKNFVGRRRSNILSAERTDVDIYFDDDCVEASIVANMFAFAFYGLDLLRSFDSLAMDGAVDIFRLVFQEKWSCLPKESLPYIPDDIPEIAFAARLQRAFIQEGGILKRISSLRLQLQHENTEIKTLAVRELKHYFCNNRNEICNSINLQIQDTNGESSISMLLQELLSLCSRECDSRVKISLAECLGAFGAIDAGKFSFKTVKPTKKMISPPWELSVKDFSLKVLKEFLVPGLSSSDGSTLKQDRIGVAVQELLHIMAKSDNLSSDNEEDLPETLKDELSQNGILEVTEPFWLTKYCQMDQTRNMTTPIFSSSNKLTFKKWIGLWAIQLSYYTVGPYHSIFENCRGVFKSKTEFSQMMLSYLFADILSQDSNRVHTILPEILSILTNAAGVYEKSRDNCALLTKFGLDRIAFRVRSTLFQQDSTSNNIFMCLNAIFDTLDTLEEWAFQCLSSLKTGTQLSTGISGSPSKEEFRDSVCRLLNQIPKDLLSLAALRMGAYARSLRYAESHCRETHNMLRRGGESSQASKRLLRYDGSNYELPQPTEALIDMLVEIYVKLGDQDALVGTESLRKIFGIAPSTYNQIMEYEQVNDVDNTMIEYESIHDKINDLYRLYPLPTTGFNPFPSTKSSGSPFKSTPYVDDKADLQDISAEEIQKSLEIVAFVERGRLLCLSSMGQYEAALNQFVSIETQLPNLEDALLPIAIECSVNLQNWEKLDLLLEKREHYTNMKSSLRIVEDNFKVHMGYLFSCIRHFDESGFAKAVAEARLDTMNGLGSLSTESYDRAYSSFVKLHILTELEQGFGYLTKTYSEQLGHMRGSDTQLLRLISSPQHKAFEVNENEWQWKERLQMMSTESRFQLQVLGVRRLFLQFCGFYNEAANNWINVSQALQSSGKFEQAKLALKHAERYGFDKDEVLIYESILVHEGGDLTAALNILEPVEPAIEELKQSYKSGQLSFKSEYKKQCFAKRILLATNWMKEGRIRYGQNIRDRYDFVLELCKDMQEANFELGKYYQMLAESSNSVIYTESDESFQTHSNSVLAFESYMKAIKHGHNIQQILPKVLSLWFAMTTPQRDVGGRRNPDTYAQKCINHITKRMKEQIAHISSSTWYSGLPQIIAWIGHNNHDTVQLIKMIVVKVLSSFPKQSIWHVATLIHSLNKERQAYAREILHETANCLQKAGDTTNAQMIKQSPKLFSCLVHLAQSLPPQNRTEVRIDCDVTPFVIPTQTSLTIDPTNSSSSLTIFPNEETIAKFEKYADVLNTKAKPKKIQIVTSTGRRVKFLVKQEKNGDLRKDVRMMEINTIINRLLRSDNGGRVRKLRLRIYCVMCLNEECGLLEWVPNTFGLRNLVAEAHQLMPPEDFPMVNIREIRGPFEKYQAQHQYNPEEMLNEYRKLILNSYRPCFHKWFLEEYREATEWLQARTNFSKSAAVWSAVGHVMGLGDRHGENILIDRTNGECVHVDFDCLFDKGLTLNRPEIVPFRLTPNMVDAMGITGIEGTFRLSLEASLKVLRDNKDLLLSFIGPFLRDPTVAWGRGGRAQRHTDEMSNNSSSKSVSAQDTENKDAEDTYKKISERLSGVYNIVHPFRDRMTKRKDQIAALPLSVTGQAQRLLEEAISEQNLAQMYIGWMPWL